MPWGWALPDKPKKKERPKEKKFGTDSIDEILRDIDDCLRSVQSGKPTSAS